MWPLLGPQPLPWPGSPGPSSPPSQPLVLSRYSQLLARSPRPCTPGPSSPLQPQRALCLLRAPAVTDLCTAPRCWASPGPCGLGGSCWTPLPTIKAQVTPGAEEFRRICLAAGGLEVDPRPSLAAHRASLGCRCIWQGGSWWRLGGAHIPQLSYPLLPGHAAAWKGLRPPNPCQALAPSPETGVMTTARSSVLLDAAGAQVLSVCPLAVVQYSGRPGRAGAGLTGRPRSVSELSLAWGL